jgi:hydrocephalus-inducing protein
VKFLNIADFSIYKDSIVPIDIPIFEPSPTMIQFSDYEPLQIKEQVFKLRNRDNVGRVVKIKPPDSRLFTIIPAVQYENNKIVQWKGKGKQPRQKQSLISAGSKVAPGMSVYYIIKFSPEAKIDYNYDLTVITERENFVVPITAIGKRSMIDFPDAVDFGHCPVKYLSSKPVIIRNLGEKTTKWELKLPKGFDSSKTEGVLEYQKSEQIILRFFPQRSVKYNLEGILKYDNLVAYVQLKGTATTEDVTLSKNFIKLDRTYINLKAQASFQIVNRSKFKVDYEWRSFKSEAQEMEKKNQLLQQLLQEEAEERMLLKEAILHEPDDGHLSEPQSDTSDDEENDERSKVMKRQKKAELLLARKYRIIRKAISDDLLLYEDDTFMIEPISGIIWPS